MDFKAEKEKAQKLINTLIDLQKKAKSKPKSSKLVIKAAEDFIKCHITNKAIYAKFKTYTDMIERVINENKG